MNAHVRPTSRARPAPARPPRRRGLPPLPGLVLAATLAAGCGGPSTGADAEGAGSLLAVRAAPVEARQGYAVRERFAGRIEARRRSELGFGRGERLVEVRVEEGDAVRAGQVLARLETRALEARARELAARTAQVEAELALARRTQERRETLARRESLSQQAYDEARFRADALAAELAAARAALEAVRVELDLSELRAPYDGLVTARLVDEGTSVVPGQPVLRMIEASHLELRVGLPPRTASALAADASYAAESDAGPLRVRLAQRVPRVAPETRTVTAVFRVEEPPEGLRHGDVARLLVEAEREAPGFWLPLDALAESHRGLWAAYALVPDTAGDAAASAEAPGDPRAAADGVRVVERRELQIVHTEAERAFVRGTLRDGDLVVTAGIHRLVPGQRVRLAP